MLLFCAQLRGHSGTLAQARMLPRAEAMACADGDGGLGCLRCERE